jgi:PAS domain S-box-containing protein
LRSLASIVESSDDAIVSKNLDGVITNWNTGAERVFGYAAKEAIGQPITIVIPQDRQDEERAILTRIRRGERIDHFETVRQRKHGSLIVVSLSVSPVKNAEGKIVGASKIASILLSRSEIMSKSPRWPGKQSTEVRTCLRTYKQLSCFLSPTHPKV